SIILSHGKRHLSEPFLRSIALPCETPEGYGKEDEAASAQCASWLADNRKKSLLADVGVGTIDQALLAVLPSRFQSLRLFGLVGHILVVDEVHAYDPYMNKLLQNLLYFHAALGGSAILLSATLPMQVRQGLITSFSRGLGMSPVPQIDCNAYPLVTKLSRDRGLVETTVAAAAQRKTRVNVEIVSERDEVQRRIVTASSQGKCVCWIRNTVHDAINGYQSLQPLIAQDRIMLFHARFAMGDRLNIENAVLKSFGYHSTSEDRLGKVLIATQVVEQSLDLDFDLLISDLAPMDLLIQRAGRLHRHLRDARGNLLPHGAGADQREPSCLIIHGPYPEEDSGDDWYKAAFPKAGFVYPSHGCLWLTMKILREKRELCMPDDARELIEAAYSEAADQMIPSPLRNRDRKADAQWQADKSLAHINMLKLEEGYEATLNQWLEDMRTPTRLGAMETTVRLARWDGVTLTPWSADGDFPWDMSQVSIRSNAVYSENAHRDPVLQGAIDKLKERLPDKGKWSVLVPMSYDADGIWRGQALDKKGSTVVLSYTSSTGITVTKKEE
ncbi:MAG: CRISPR-associated helicase Cas3', partial [Holophaga sp.]|nr:CRISPR-associated helicase Cas3' [Holophaga sp.]